MLQTAHEFLSALYPEPLHHWASEAGRPAPELVLWTLPKQRNPSTDRSRSRSYWLPSVDAAARQAETLRADRNVFFGVALQDRMAALDAARETRPKATARSVRGRQETAVGLPAVWVDLDVAGPGHSSDTLPPTRDAALGLLAAVPQPPSAVVWSGGGFHVYWLLREVRRLNSSAARTAAHDLLQRVQWAVQREAQTRGWMVDSTAELARVLRLPGTLNHKASFPRETVIEHLDPTQRYHAADFDLLDGLPSRDPSNTDPAQTDPSQAARAGPIASSTGGEAGVPADFEPIHEGCSWLRSCQERSWTLTEPEWFAQLTIVARCASQEMDSRTLVHTLSSDYPRYDPAETDRKMQHALGPRSQPFTCGKIAREFGAHQQHCEPCPHRGDIKSPIVLGRRRGIGSPPVTSSPGSPPPGGGQGGGGQDGGVPGGGEAGVGGRQPTGGRQPIQLSHLENEVADQALAAVAERESNLFRRGGTLVQVVQWDEGVSAVPGSSDTSHPGFPPWATGCRPPGSRGWSGPSDASNEVSSNTVSSDTVSSDTVLSSDTVPADSATPIHRGLEAPAARQVQDARMRELLATHCEFQAAQRTKQGRHWRPVHPPAWVPKAILGRFDWPTLPRLEGVVEGPVLRSDGSVLQTPGYDLASGLFLAPQVEFQPVPEAPTEEQCESALLELTHVVADFPFASPAHLSGWLAALLTPLARFAFAGPSPVNLIDANVRGAGKSLLADVCHLIVTGRPAPRMPYARDENELRKEITSIALKARQIVVIDNVTGAFGSPTLDLAVTATSWADRLLGQNVDLELPLAITWYVTGNNIELAGDMPRRCLHIRLESPEEKPEHRGGFRHPRLAEWLVAERPRLLPAALTLLAGYQHAGRPDQGLMPWGSFEGWSDLVRSTLVWLDLPDPASINQDIAVVHPRGAAEARLLAGLEEVLPTLGGAATVRQILRALEDNALLYETLRSALEDLVPRLRRGDLPTPVKFGSILRSLRGRQLGSRRLHTGEKTRQGLTWAIGSTRDCDGVTV